MRVDVHVEALGNSFRQLRTKGLILTKPIGRSPPSSPLSVVIIDDDVLRCGFQSAFAKRRTRCTDGGSARKPLKTEIVSMLIGTWLRATGAKAYDAARSKHEHTLHMTSHKILKSRQNRHHPSWARWTCAKVRYFALFFPCRVLT